VQRVWFGVPSGEGRGSRFVLHHADGSLLDRNHKTDERSLLASQRLLAEANLLMQHVNISFVLPVFGTNGAWQSFINPSTPGISHMKLAVSVSCYEPFDVLRDLTTQYAEHVICIDIPCCVCRHHNGLKFFNDLSLAGKLIR
jgi:hypothetical protein